MFILQDVSDRAPCVVSRQLTLVTHYDQEDRVIPHPLSNTLIVISSNKADEALCRCTASAYLSGVPVVVAGYQTTFRGFFSKYDFVEKAIVNAKL
ncbi:unnamed protein product [Phytomonas sp. EM1]|nr:unnamed protein product [Phytomonas sp. EM1]|eukprot:CCW60550.1 unnamed protein product [Phytomonas sp. isolate EM1]